MLVIEVIIGDMSKKSVCVCMSACMHIYVCVSQLVEIIGDLHTGTHCQVRTAGGTSEKFEVNSGVQQGCVFHPSCSTVSLTRS